MEAAFVLLSSNALHLYSNTKEAAGFSSPGHKGSPEYRTGQPQYRVARAPIPHGDLGQNEQRMRSLGEFC